MLVLRFRLLRRIAGGRKRVSNSFLDIARLVLDELPETGGDVTLHYVDVAFSGYRRELCPHQPGE